MSENSPINVSSVIDMLQKQQQQLDTARSLACKLTGYIEGLSSQFSDSTKVDILQDLIEFHTRNPLPSSSEWIEEWKEQINSLNHQITDTDVKFNPWKSTKFDPPPANFFVETKIDDERGCRNEGQILRRKEGTNLWFGRDGLYVYYTPTHWRFIENW